jgi:hypothetical protein
MDKFEEAMADLAQLSESDRKKLNKQDKGHCICPTCPTYADCAKKKKEIMFCFEGKSSCIIASKGCHCPGCPVKADYGLVNIYFCLNGTELETRNGK